MHRQRNMLIEHTLANVFRMSDGVWKRHANLWSVWTRYAALPLFVAAIWSRLWIGWWALVPTAVVMVWIWLNPRIFPRPASTNNWASKAVLGERVWLNRSAVPIPAHHQRAAKLLNILAASGFLVLIFGLVMTHIASTVVGLIVVVLGKSWFLDRMVWLFEDMAETHPEYSEWLY